MRLRKNSRHQGIGLGVILAIAAVILVALAAWKINAEKESEAIFGDERAIIGRVDLMKVVTNPELEESMVAYKGMDISFNPRMHIPNWVCWELTADETDGSIPRSNKFLCDESVPGCAEPYDYNYSGYDRGHMAPAGDMKWDKDAMSETFYMTNICPQSKTLNTGTWKRLEQKCRTWAQADSAVIIVCGPILTDKITEYIGDSRVAVPKRFFKVILSPYAEHPRGIGFIMPNDKVEGGMQAAAVSIDEVERVTGHDFFSELPDSIENIIEAQCDFHYWSTIKPPKKSSKK
ncbi:MAG: DNA/RNA non-specific endonuclease [Paramuribaculum sp.]|nr:DNA/RNA non-specific endonuclease [Paramuribaculum sp.]